MDSRIIEDFQNLHVLAAYDLAIMDDLVHDLTVALEESSKTHRSCQDGSGMSQDALLRRRRRFKKRRANGAKTSIHGANMSEGTESSLDEAFKDYIENFSRQSDSDEFLVSGQKVPAVRSFPILSVPQFVESDSVTENITPLRPQRRRRHFKRMAIDSQPQVDFGGLLKSDTDFQQMSSAESLMLSEAGCVGLHLLSGKRKRSSKDKGNGFYLDFNDDSLPDSQNQCQNHVIDSNISSLSSEEGENGSSAGDGEDGDDEESDTFRESEGEAAKGPGAPNITEEEAEKMDIQGMDAIDMRKIFDSGLDILSPTSRNCFKARMKLLSGRQMHAGRRRLKDRHPAYSLSAFLQERQMWLRGCAGRQQPAGTAPGGNSKRHRRMLPTDTGFEMMTEHSEPIAFSTVLTSGSLLFGIQGAPPKLFTIGPKHVHRPSTLSHHFVS